MSKKEKENQNDNLNTSQKIELYKELNQLHRGRRRHFRRMTPKQYGDSLRNNKKIDDLSKIDKPYIYVI